MADWDIIECGFNTADETINFGTRNFADGDNLYEACTLASIKNSKLEEHGSNLLVKAIIKNNRVFLVIDNTIKAFTDVLCNELLVNVTFDEVIDTFYVTTDNRFLIACLRNGILHCLDMWLENEIIFSKIITENNYLGDVCYVQCFAEYCNNNGILSLLLITKNGNVFRVKCELYSNKLQKKISTEEDFNKIDVQLIVDLKISIKHASFNDPFLLLDGSEMLVYDTCTEEIITDDSLDLKQIYPYNESMFIAIDVSGNLILICCRTLLTSYINCDVQFESFIYVKSLLNSDSQIFAITKTDELGLSHIQSFTYPGFSLVFSLKLAGDACLIYPEHIHDEYMYIAIIKNETSVEELRFLQIVETVPENRLRRLLRRHKFDEAVKFAKDFNLDLVEIQKAKAQFIVDKNICSETDISNLLDILNTISDVYFKLKCCFDVFNSCENLEDVNKVLHYGCHCVPKRYVTDDDGLHNIISEKLFHFETFRLIQRQSKYSVDWLTFSEYNLIDYLCTSLQHSNIEEAIIAYNRLNISSSQLDVSKIEAILHILNNLPLDVCKPFLYTFFPITLSYMPNTLPMLLNWLKQKLFYTEQNCNDGFSPNTTEFVNNIIQVLKVDNIGCFSFHQQYTLNKNAIDDLSNLVNALKTMQILKDMYHICIPLKDYLKGPKSLVSTLLRINVNDDIYETLLENFLSNFISENYLQPDDIFLEEICDLVNYDEEFWIKVVPPILKCISSVEKKLEAVITILKNADVPWCQTLHSIANSSLAYKHEMVEIIKLKIKLEPIDTILRKPAYNLPKDVDLSRDFKFVLGKILYCNETTMVQDVYRLCKNSEEKQLATLKLVDKFVRSNNFTAALQVLNNCNSEEVVEYCNSLIILLKCYDEHESLYKIIEKYATIINSICRRFKEKHKECNQKEIEESFENLKNYIRIKERFHENVKFVDLENSRPNLELCNSLLCKIAEEFEACEFDVNEGIQLCRQVSLCSHKSEEWIMIKLCRILNNFNFTYEIAKALYLRETVPENLCAMALLILKSVGCWNLGSNTMLEQSNASFGDGNLSVQVNSSVDIGTYVLGLQLAQKLATKAILESKCSDINACVEVFNWAISSFFICYGNEKLNKSQYILKISNIETPSPAFGTLHSFKWVFNFYTEFIAGHGNNKNADMKSLTCFDEQINNLDEEQFIEKLKQLPTIIRNLCLEGHNLTAFKLVITLRSALSNAKEILNFDVYKMLDGIIMNQCIPHLLQKSFAGHSIDTEGAYMLLLCYKRKDLSTIVTNYLSIHKRNVQKLAVIAQLALRLDNFHKTNANREFYIDAILLSKWWERIDNSQITMKDFFTSSTKSDLADKLIEHQLLNLKMLTEFCKDFNLCTQTSYNIYLKSMLTKWCPDYETTKDEYGIEKIVMRNSEDQLFEKCKAVVDLIKDKQSLYTFIKSFVSLVNFYHYEVFMCIFKIQAFLNENVECREKLMLLIFLKSYRRFKTPGNAEIEEWFTAFPDSQAIDSLSQWRLPFTLTLFTSHIWKIIRPEINLKTYLHWFKAAPMLDKFLNKNDICSYVVKEVISSGVLKEGTDKEWNLQPVHEDLLEEIDICIRNMTDLEKATSAVYHLMAQTPKGADQVNAAKLCVKYAEKYKQHVLDSDPSVLKAYTKVMYKYLHFSASHILHKYRLADSKYTELLPHSNELIDALYMDDRILKRADSVILDCPDINKAVDELGNLFDINIKAKRLTLLESLLSDTSQVMECMSSCLKAETNVWENTNADNLKRASYICQSDDLLFWQQHLLNDQLFENKNIRFRANAWRCFCMISDASTIEQLTNTPREDFLNYIDKLFILSDLESMGFCADVEQLNKQNKHELLKRLSKNISSPLVVKIMASICMTYSLDDLRYWEVIVNSSIKLKLYQQIRKYVFFLKKVANFKYRKFYIDAWQTIIDQSFNISSNNDEELHKLCIENIFTIQTCPVLLSLNLENVFKSCCQLKQYDIAAIIIQYLPQEDQEKCTLEVLSYEDALPAKIVKLSNCGIWGTSYVLDMLYNFS